MLRWDISGWFLILDPTNRRLKMDFNTGKWSGRDRMVVGFKTTYAISAYHHWCCEFESRSGGDGQHSHFITDKICQWLATGRWFSSVSSTNKTDSHDKTEILLKVCVKHHQTNKHNNEAFFLFFFIGDAGVHWKIRRIRSSRGCCVDISSWLGWYTRIIWTSTDR